MSHADLTLSAWLDLSDEAAGRTAAAIARSTETRLAGVGPHEYAGRPGRVARAEITTDAAVLSGATAARHSAAATAVS